MCVWTSVSLLCVSSHHLRRVRTKHFFLFALMKFDNPKIKSLRHENESGNIRCHKVLFSFPTLIFEDTRLVEKYIRRKWTPSFFLSTKLTGVKLIAPASIRHKFRGRKNRPAIYSPSIAHQIRPCYTILTHALNWCTSHIFFIWHRPRRWRKKCFMAQWTVWSRRRMKLTSQHQLEWRCDRVTRETHGDIFILINLLH